MSLPNQAEAARVALHARLLRDRTLQFDLLAPTAPRPLREPGWLRPLVDALAKVIAWAMPVLKVVFWAGLAAAILLIVFLIVREVLGVRLAGRRRERAARGAPADFAPDPRRARALLENADRLAAQGRFDQAVRLILHRSVEDIETRRPRLVRPALTARELAALEAVPGAARAAFAKVAAIVEYSAFAGRPIGAGEYTTCREAYEAFAFPEAWR